MRYLIVVCAVLYVVAGTGAYVEGNTTAVLGWGSAFCMALIALMRGDR